MFGMFDPTGTGFISGEQCTQGFKSLCLPVPSDIKDSISIKVKNQYEENPYPRWTNLGLSIEPRTVEEVIENINLDIELKKINDSK